MPGLLVLAQLRSCVPKPEVNGEPTSRPLPGIVTQFTPSFRPASAQLALLMPLLTTPEPGKLRYVAAMLPEGAEASKAEESYHPLAMLALPWGLRTVY